MDKCAEMPSLDPVGSGDRATSVTGCRTARPIEEAVRRRVAHVELAKSAGPAGREDENGNRS
jgi:hypothetical protein